MNAITAAGVTYAVTRACTMGELVECSCEKMTTKGDPTAFPPFTLTHLSFILHVDRINQCTAQVVFHGEKSKSANRKRLKVKSNVRNFIYPQPS